MRNLHIEPTLLQNKVEFSVKEKKKGATGTYLTLQEKRDLREELGEPAFILFDCLMDMTRFRNPDTSINGLMKVTGWTVSKVRRTRLALVSSGWMEEVNFRSSKGSKLTVTYLGKELVRLARKGESEKGTLADIKKVMLEYGLCEADAWIKLGHLEEASKGNEELTEKYIKSNPLGDATAHKVYAKLKERNKDIAYWD